MNLLSRYEALHEQATRATGGLTDFGDDDYIEPLRMLLRSYDLQARLGDLGQQIILNNIVGDLTARLLEEQGYKDFPQHLDVPIRKPIIILGMARTGTTVLHRLIGQDPALQDLPLWLASAPMPRPRRESWAGHPAYRQVQAGFDQLHQLSPKFKAVHPQSAEAPDECRFIINHSFRSPSYAATSHVPEYTACLQADDGRIAYRRYRRTLGLIGGGSPRRWVLKCPTHLWRLPALLEVLPDACIVMTHRDPASSATSIISLVYELIRLTEPETSPEAFAREHLALWKWVLDKAEHDRERIDPKQILDLHFDDVRSDPLGTVERIYAYFDIPVSSEARSRWQRYVAHDPSGGHAPHHYTPEDFGLTATGIRGAMRASHERFLAVEQTRARRKPSTGGGQ